MDLQVSPVFAANYKAEKRHVSNRGGTRSGKSYSILQVLIVKHALRKTGLIIDICRKTQAELRATIMIDFFQILESMNLYNPVYHNKTNMEYRLHGCLFRFIGLDRAQKKRGAYRDILYCNEANGLTLEDWVQLSVRCKGQIYYDYNPSEYFWLNEHVEEKDPSLVDIIHSTYLDNYDFLPTDQIAQIENLINIDDFYYKVYVLGIIAIMKGKIYDGYVLIEDEEYDNLYEDETFYGLDFGWDHATSLMEVKTANGWVYERERYHESHKHDEDLIQWMEEHEIDKGHPIYADPANASAVRKIKAAGYNIHLAKKDVRDGLRFCQSLKRKICRSSTTYVKSIGKYKFKQTSDGVIIEEPVKIDDDNMDAMRYAEFTHLRRQISPIMIR